MNCFQLRLKVLPLLCAASCLCPLLTQHVLSQEAKPPPLEPLKAPNVVPALRVLPAMRIQPAAPAFQPARKQGLQLETLVLAKYDTVKDKPSLVVIVEQFRTEKKKQTIQRLVQEKRTRTRNIVKGDGTEEQIEETYTVVVPVQDTREFDIQVSAGKKPKVVPLESAKLYRLDGTLVDDKEEIAKLLSKVTPVFLVPAKSKVEPANDVIQQALKSNTLVLATDEVKTNPVRRMLAPPILLAPAAQAPLPRLPKAP